MTTAEACLKLVEELPGSLVESLIAQLRAGAVPAMPNPGYQGRVDEFLRCQADVRGELAPMLEVALAAKRSRQTAELVWTGPSTPVVPVRGTEQVLCDLIRCAERRLTMTSFGIFQVPRLVEELEQSLERGVALRIVLGDREVAQRPGDRPPAAPIGPSGGSWGVALAVADGAAASRDEQGHAGLMHVKAAVADSKRRVPDQRESDRGGVGKEHGVGRADPWRRRCPRRIDRLIDTLVESGELQMI